MTNDLQNLFEEDANREVSSEDLRLGELGRLVNLQIDLTKEMEELSEELASVQKRLKDVSEQAIPDLMQQLGGIQKIKVNGWVIEVKKWYSGSISEVNRPSAFKWLAEHKHDALIKNDVMARFGKGEDSKAEDLVKTIRNLGYEVEQKKYVHPQTLKAFIREQMEKGVDFPQDLFGVFTGYATTVKRG